MKPSTELRAWVDEAIQSLGYIKPEVASRLVRLIQRNENQHPKQIATSHRKEGEQLSSEEKKALGLRANAMMSRDALGDLTDKGLTVPLAAHEQTILRASLAWGRAKSIASESDMGVSKWECLAPFPADCPGCKRLDGKVLSVSDVAPIGPHDCFREACAISFAPQIDENFMAQSQPSKPPSRQISKPWWKFW